MRVILNDIILFTSTIYTIFETVISLVSALISILVSSVGFLFEVISILPAAFSISLIALVSVAVIYKLIGREAGN